MKILINIVIVILLIILSYQDIKNKEISLVYIAAIALVNIFYLLIDGRIFSDFIYIIIIAATILIIGIIFKKYIGFGDILLLVSIAIYLKFDEMMFVLLLSSLIASGFGIIMIIFKKIKINGEIPYVPFLTLSYLCMLFGRIL